MLNSCHVYCLWLFLILQSCHHPALFSAISGTVWIISRYVFTTSFIVYEIQPENPSFRVFSTLANNCSCQKCLKNFISQCIWTIQPLLPVVQGVFSWLAFMDSTEDICNECCRMSMKQVCITHKLMILIFIQCDLIHHEH